MTGLNFQTETIVNSADLILNSNAAKGVKFGPNFADAVIKRIQKTAGTEAVPHTFTVDLSTAIPQSGTAYYSLNLSISMQGAEPFIYSNAMAKKYIPLCVEFSVNAGATKVAEAVKKIIDKNQLFVIGNALLKVTASTNTLTIQTAEEFQRISKCELVNITNAEEAPSVVANAVTESTTKPADSFGTYSYLVKNLRLPTVENLRWNAKSEMPEVGALYDQYVFEVEAPAGNGGLHAVGQRMTSHTVHSFWVKRGIKNVWEDKNPIGVSETSEASVLND